MGSMQKTMNELNVCLLLDASNSTESRFGVGTEMRTTCSRCKTKSSAITADYPVIKLPRVLQIAMQLHEDQTVTMAVMIPATPKHLQWSDSTWISLESSALLTIDHGRSAR